MATKFRISVRLLKKIRVASGRWQFVSLPRNGARYVWDPRPGIYFLDWWEDGRRHRESAGPAPSQALEAQRRKIHELAGRAFSDGDRKPKEVEGFARGTPIQKAIEDFLAHVRVHSPDKPNTVKRYRAVLDHLESILGRRSFIEALTRSDIDRYKSTRLSQTQREGSDRKVQPSTINFEISTLRTFFNFLIRERAIDIENPCSRFRPLRDMTTRGRPKVYTSDEVEKILSASNGGDKLAWAILLLTGLREQELCFLTWDEVCLDEGQESITVRKREGFSPKDYEERELPIPDALSGILRDFRRKALWVVPAASNGRETHLLRRLKRVAALAGVEDATLHKFRHTYATRLLENGADIVTVQRLLGHSDLDTTKRYLNPDAERKRLAVQQLTVPRTIDLDNSLRSGQRLKRQKVVRMQRQVSG